MTPTENPEAERTVLAVLASLSALSVAKAQELLDSLRLAPEDFARLEHADLYRAATEFLRRGAPMELFSLEAALAPSAPVKRAGGRKWLAELLVGAAKGSAPEAARVMLDASLRRRALTLLRAIAERLKDPASQPEAALVDGAAAWGELTAKGHRLGTAEGDALRLASELDDAQKGRRELVIPTGIRLLDEAIGGLQPSHLTLIGALPGVGKSALLATVARNLAKSGRRVGFFSLEDERLWVARRWLAHEARVPVFVLATRPLSTEQADAVEDAQPRVYETLQRLVIDDRPALTPQQVAATASDMVLNLGCKAIVVDHLGEMRLERSERYDLDISEALALLRNVAKRHRVPVVVASHVRRRQGLGIEDAPSLTDFANSSAPERMARVALGLSKPREDVLRVTVLKQTNGRSGMDVDLSLAQASAMVDSHATPAPVQEAQ